MRRHITAAGIRYGLLLAVQGILLVKTASPWLLIGLLAQLILPIISWCSNFYVRRHIRVQLQIPTTTSKNSAVMVDVELKNDSILPVLKAYCKVRLVNDLTGETETVTLPMSVGAKEKSAHTFLLESACCGRLYVSAEHVVLMDYFGLIPLKADVNASGRMTVLPEMFSVETMLRPYYYDSDDGSVQKKGDDRSEIYQLREYQRGDDVRQIHWKLSSKLDQLIYREASAPQNRSMMVFWDKRIPGTPAQMDALAESVASVCHGLLQNGMPFHLYWTEGDDLQISDITDEDTLLQAIPALVKNTGTEECRLPDMESYGRIVCFGTCPLEQAEHDERIYTILCTDEEADNRNTCVITPENYFEVLQRLEI